MDGNLNYLLDTNVISELRKQARCDANVKQWFSSTASEQLFISVLVIGELRKGVELIRRRDAAAAFHLETWLNTVTEQFSQRILMIDDLIAEEWGKMSAVRPLYEGLVF